MQLSNIIRRASGLAFALAIFASTAVSAQSYQDMDQAWWTTLSNQLTESVASDVDQVRQEAMQHIVFFAENYDEFVNFDEAAYEIMGRFEASENVEERLLALAALSAIGEDITMERLSVVAMDLRSERVRNVAAAVILAYSTSS
ncbi:MAG: hypothetical protein HKN29_08260 [Rhodothermales bacterium]|nr:hypothetical protein [Rhodothermales bacterium]